ncbi:nucleotide-binding protein [uncultured Methanomethylovorans sp.]|uniref:nucleotide-binding protein n=1 Tax=uncultured Methanomethylovorans sp. TaxID=183759 RepID=UPI002AA95677|nr:nucleotide-binding protein [uncultured Methanomethylovorans sp.]
MSEEDGYYYHVRITLKSNRITDELKLDLDRKTLNNRFIIPYELGNIIMVKGKHIDPSDIERIQINRTQVPSSQLLTKIRAKRAGSRVGLPISDEWYVTKEGEDLTDKLVLGPPGYKKEKKKNLESMGHNTLSSSSKIFIVHGHDEEMKQSVARIIEKLGLEAIILHEKANEGLKSIIEKFEKHSSNASFAIILLSPDDKGCTANSFPNAAKFRARQNVILELGYFIGKLGRERVLALYKQSTNFELPSDIAGTLYTPYDNKWQFELVRELKAYGYDVDANKLL